MLAVYLAPVRLLALCSTSDFVFTGQRCRKDVHRESFRIRYLLRTRKLNSGVSEWSRCVFVVLINLFSRRSLYKYSNARGDNRCGKLDRCLAS